MGMGWVYGMVYGSLGVGLWWSILSEQMPLVRTYVGARRDAIPTQYIATPADRPVERSVAGAIDSIDWRLHGTQGAGYATGEEV